MLEPKRRLQSSAVGFVQEYEEKFAEQEALRSLLLAHMHSTCNPQDQQFFFYQWLGIQKSMKRSSLPG